MKIASAAILAVSFLLVAAGASAAEVQCAKHKQLVGLLAKKYSENPVGMGTISEDRFMQIFVSPEGSWTVLVTRTDGQACIVAAGQNWEKTQVAPRSGPSA